MGTSTIPAASLEDPILYSQSLTDELQREVNTEVT